MCEKPGSTRCSHCHSIYCSKECQEKDWESHKMVCTSFPDFSEEHRPSSVPDTIISRALLFPVDSIQPQWIWLPSSHKEIPLELKMKYFGTSIIESHPLNSHLSHINLEHTLITIHPPNMPDDGMVINNSLLALGSPGYMRVQYGNVIITALRSKRINSNTDLAQDLTMRDYRLIVDYFQMWHENPCVVNPERYPYKMTPGIKINSVSDRHRFCLTEPDSVFQSITVPAKIFDHNPRCPSAFAFLAGLPWFYNPAASDFADFRKSDLPNAQLRFPSLENPEVGWLGGRLQELCCIRPGEDQYPEMINLPGMIMGVNLGTLIFTHLYGVKLFPAQLQVFNEFVTKQLE